MEAFAFRSLWRLIWALSVVLFLYPCNAWAIPSPDLVVNIFASAAQFIGLSAAVLGAGFLGRRRLKKQGALSRSWQKLLWGVSLLLLISLCANLLQYLWQMDKRSQRLQTNLWRSSKETGKNVGDTSLKTLPFSKQLKSPYGISTDTLSTWLEQGKPINLIDVRETEEYEVGYINGALHSRYPDTQINAAKLLSKDKENVLLCYSGNRSSELCIEFAKQGISCRFMVGGYEKWIAENRLLASTGGKGIELRGLPKYPNQDTLLDTPEVMEKFIEGNFLFVDVRYPGDFAQQHLPDAVNIPLRKMTTAEIDEALSNLPRKPIIAPCYDKRSCFYANVLGIKLWRLGYDYQGRYTVPHEFAFSGKEKSYVAEWKAGQEQQTLLSMVLAPLRILLIWLYERTGSLTIAILAAAVLLRFIVLPISYKSERDNFVLRKISPEVNAIKERWKADRARLSRAMMRLYQRKGFTPGLNMVGNIIQLLLFPLFFSVVQTVSKDSSESFLWISAINKPDPLWLLPSFVVTMTVMFLLNIKEKRTGIYLTVCMAAGALLLILTVPLNAAANLYLAGSLAFLIVQNRMINVIFTKREQTGANRVQRQPFNTGIITLREAHYFTETGNKSSRLGQMMAAGLPVPDGFVVTDALLCGTDKASDCERQFTESESASIHKAFAQLGIEKAAVRSTGRAEDGKEQSFAGVFESVLNVKKDNLLDAIAQVRKSYCNIRQTAYSNNTNEKGCVLIQAMVPAEYAGVMFTQHPSSTGSILIEFVEGLGESLVSGSAKPCAVQYGRISSAPLEDNNTAPIDLAPLIELGRKIEELFCCPQDIEWAYAKGQFFILQARDITTAVIKGEGSLAIMEAERQRLLKLTGVKSGFDKPVYVQNELAELLPKPTPLSLSLMESLWSYGGSTDIACNRLGIPYEVHDDSLPYIASVFGSLYINRAEGELRIAKGASAIASFRLSRQADEIELEFLEEFLPQFQKEMRMREALDLTRLSVSELIQLLDEWRSQFVTDIYIHAEVINIAADFYLKAAERALKKHGMDPAAYLGYGPETVMQRAYTLLPEIQGGQRPLNDFLALYGYRAMHDYELSEPRYNERPASLNQLIETATAAPHVKQSALPEKRFLKTLVERARRFQSLKEDAKHYCIRTLASLRPLLLELDHRLKFDGNIFYLRLEEIPALLPSDAGSAMEIIRTRRQQSAAFEAISLPTELSIVQLEKIMFDSTGHVSTSFKNTGAIIGKRVSGEKEVIGPVRIMDHPEHTADFQNGEIIVARFAEPELYSLFSKASGIITEVGGWLSHMAIVAREYQLPCIVQANGVTNSLKTGQMVRLCANGMIDRRLNTGDRRRQATTTTSDRRSHDRRRSGQNIADTSASAG